MEIDDRLLAPPIVPGLRRVFQETAYLFPGLRLVLNEQVFFEPEGLSAFAALHQKAAVEPKLWYRGTVDGMRIDLALNGTAPEPLFARSWVNGVEARFGGSHARALERALGRAGWCPSVQMFSLIQERPAFTGPTRERLHMPGIVVPLEACLTEILITQG